MIEGILLVDKPAGVTSYDVVRRVKQASGVKKVGHGGTLDPFATGLLVVLIGRRYTRMQSRLTGGDKVYEAVITLGLETDTGDLTGNVVKRMDTPMPGMDTVRQVLRSFVGEILQKPHPFSAVKYQGRPLYYYARRGIRVPVNPRAVHLYDLALRDYSPPDMAVTMRVSGGFYVRSFAVDVGAALGIGGVVRSLRRLSVNDFHVRDAIAMSAIQKGDPGFISHIMQVESADVSVL